ncbi:MAG: phosphate/phosphite/phosphonate ABC transporter substrate-binding protein [Myxococcales bacterium]|nr:phosphate/phosphite/phosphonate ABC transporter substrate-binding protein [Myxococcales bacterium]
MNDGSKNNGMIATDVLAPTRVIAGKYHLGKVLGEGGMGAVYEADHRELGAKVAVKLLSEASVNNPSSLARFRREAKVMGQIRHENVISVMDAGNDESGVPFLVMELLEGESLAGTLRRERLLSPGLSAWIISEVLAGLGAAHAKNIIHRDLKPGNVFIATQSDGSRRVKILDFGISKLGDTSATLNVTAQGALVGTPNFMSPEQIRAREELDGRVDIYAAGILLYRMVTGRLPYVGSNAEELYRNIFIAQPTPPTELRPELSPGLEAVILKAMCPERDNRYQTPYEFSDALQQAVPSEGYGSGRQAPTRPFVPSAMMPGRSMPTTDLGPNNKTWQWIALMVIVLGAIIGGVVTYSITKESKKAEQAGTAEGKEETPAVSLVEGKPLYFAVTRHKNPEDIVAELRPLTNYLSKEIQRPVEIKIVDNYDDVSSRLNNGQIHLAALSAANYVRAKRRLPTLKLLATPTTSSGPSYGAYILAKADSGIRTLEDLKDKTFCYTSKSSSSGYLYPRAVFREQNINPDTHLQTRFTSDHMESLRVLETGGCDGAAVYDKIWIEAAKSGLEASSFTVLATTERVAWDAYCVTDMLDEKTTEALTRALTNLKQGSALSKSVLLDNELPFSGFLPADDSLYEPTRRIEKFLSLEKQQDTAPSEEP